MLSAPLARRGRQLARERDAARCNHAADSTAETLSELRVAARRLTAGIGLELAQLMAVRGGHVIGVGRSVERWHTAE